MWIMRKAYHKLPTGVRKKVKKAVKYMRAEYKDKSNRRITKQEIVQNLKDMGIQQGDIVYVQSSLRSIGNVIGGPDTVIDALIEAVGPKGTVAMPAFSIPKGGMLETLERGEVFDPDTTPSTIGLVQETFRKREGVLRSIHPTSSVSAFGSKAKLIIEGHHTSGSNFGVGTPLHKIIKHGGKTIGIGVELDKVSFYHTAEDVVVPFPLEVYWHEDFDAKVLENGKLTTMKVRPLSPKVSKTRIDKRPAGDWIRNLITDILIDRGVLKYGYIGDARTWIMRADEFLEVYKDLLGKNISIYTTEKDYKATGQTLIQNIKNFRSAYSDRRRDYLQEQIEHIKKGYEQKGFWDPENKCWIRQLDWSGTDWVGYVPHDWKYAIEMQEGALHYALATGLDNLDDQIKDEFNYIHAKIRPDGSIDGVPDGVPFLSEEYEYGAVLSCFALGYLYLKNTDPAFAKVLLEDMDRLYTIMRQKFGPMFEDHHSVVLRGYSNLYMAWEAAARKRELKDLKTEMLAYADEFIKAQLEDGLIPFKPRENRTAIQMQLKAVIGLALASKATGSKKCLKAAKKNFEWVITNLLLPNGGLQWSLKNKEVFFEIHQMLFLVCYRYLLTLSKGKYDYSRQAISVWKFLLQDNFANIDMYVHNQRRTGAFFSYRCVDSNGNPQPIKTHGKFKGSYELGYTLWGLGLNYDLSL